MSVSARQGRRGTRMRARETGGERLEPSLRERGVRMRIRLVERATDTVRIEIRGRESKGEIKATDVDREAIMVTLNYSLTGPGYGPIVNPKVQNITADGFTVNGVKKTAVTLDGLAESHIKGVAVSNSTFTSVTTAKPSIKNADGTTFTNVTINGKKV